MCWISVSYNQVSLLLPCQLMAQLNGEVHPLLLNRDPCFCKPVGVSLLRTFMCVDTTHCADLYWYCGTPVHTDCGCVNVNEVNLYVLELCVDMPSSHLGMVTHFVLLFWVLIAFSSSSSCPVFFSFFTRLFTAFSHHFSSCPPPFCSPTPPIPPPAPPLPAGVFFHPRRRFTTGGVKGRMEDMAACVCVFLCEKMGEGKEDNTVMVSLNSYWRFDNVAMYFWVMSNQSQDIGLEESWQTLDGNNKT